MQLSLDRYRLLGRSGLRVSPLSLGTMTFGTEWGWGSDTVEAASILDRYVERGGNFVDTAVNYTSGASERMLGELIKGRRERLVVATKYTMALEPGDPNSGGNHRLNMIRSVETSLRQLGTDRIDLFYLHAWDFTTRPDEAMRGLDDLVRAGKIVYAGICNAPAWRVAEMQTLADLRGWSPLVALQVEYSLVERTTEHELLPMAKALGLGVLPWSPLGGGVLTGKYRREDVEGTVNADVAPTRKGVIASFGHMTEAKIALADVVREVAAEVGATPAQVALAWTLLHPAVTSPVMGVRTLAQLDDNLGALDVQLSDDQRLRLNAASRPSATFPNSYFALPIMDSLIFGGARVDR